MDLLFDGRQADQAEVDQEMESMLEDMRSQGVDLTQPIAVAEHLSFRTDFEAMRGGADLLLAGWPGVRTGGGGTATHLPTVIALYEPMPTVDSLRAARQQLLGFAAARGGMVVADQEGGDSPFVRNDWKRGESGVSEAELQLGDQQLVDSLFAWDIDVKERVTLTSGIGLPSQEQARAAAAELFLDSWPEVHVVQSEMMWVVETVTYVVAEAKALGETRRGLTNFAMQRGGSWLGFAFKAAAPKQVEEES